jgi:hypothetical protein
MSHKLNQKVGREIQGNTAVLEAVETLADIAELNFEHDNNTAKIDEINEHNREVTAVAAKRLHLESETPDEAVKAIREIFHVVYQYIQNFYKQGYRQTGNQEAIEGVKTIMVIVGEAVQRLDHYTSLFNKTKEKRVANLKEYKQLQDFYLNRISRKIDQGVLSKWILELAKDSMSRAEQATAEVETTTQTKHIFIDMVSVKNDSEYELFFLRKEDGSRFFNPKLIRNIKLVCDFERRIGKDGAADRLESLQHWQDRLSYYLAKNMIQSITSIINLYFHETKSHTRWDIVRYLNKALMALLLCSNPKNLMRNSPVKTCFEYFNDFLGFLREAMLTKEYKRWITYPPKKTNITANSILDVTHELCRVLMSSNRGVKEISDSLYKILDEVEIEGGEKEKHEYIWGYIIDNNTKIGKLIKLHPNGPLMKVLDIIKQGGYYAFDPISQYNIPEQLYSVYVNEKKMTNLRIPSPTYQEYIHKAFVIEEFKGFLRSYNRDGSKKKHLLINLQDRTSWREHFRSIVLEELQNHSEFENAISVVTLSKDTDFYEQSSIYSQENHADVFIENFKDQLTDQNCGFYFSKEIAKELFPKFADGVMAAIHRIFFRDKNVLSVSNRRDFIELFYLFLELKILDIVQPDTFSLTCKDSLDVGSVSNALLYTFLKLINGEPIKGDEIRNINMLIQIPPLLIRERAIDSDRLNRMVDVLKLIEYTQEEYGAKAFVEIIKEGFGLFYKNPILHATVINVY